MLYNVYRYTYIRTVHLVCGWANSFGRTGLGSSAVKDKHDRTLPFAVLEERSTCVYTLHALTGQSTIVHYMWKWVGSQNGSKRVGSSWGYNTQSA